MCLSHLISLPLLYVSSITSLVPTANSICGLELSRCHKTFILASIHAKWRHLSRDKSALRIYINISTAVSALKFVLRGVGILIDGGFFLYLPRAIITYDVALSGAATLPQAISADVGQYIES
jgi:hypothetical protein